MNTQTLKFKKDNTLKSKINQNLIKQLKLKLKNTFEDCQ